MSEERKRILNMLAQNKITAEDAEALLDAMSPAPATGATDGGGRRDADPKYLRVLVEDVEDGHTGKVNVRVPFQLIAAQRRLADRPDAGHHCCGGEAWRQGIGGQSEVLGDPCGEGSFDAQVGTAHAGLQLGVALDHLMAQPQQVARLAARLGR